MGSDCCNNEWYQPPWTFRPSCYARRLPIDTCLVSKEFYKSPLTNYVFGVAIGGLLLKLQNFKKVKLIFGHPVQLWLHAAHHISFLLNWFSVKYRFIFPIFTLFLPWNHLTLLKHRFLKKMLFKKGRTRRLFFFPILPFFTVKSPNVTQTSVSQENAV